MTEVLNFHGQIRRTDVLLRSRFPNLVTRIFEILPARFVIYFEKGLQDAATVTTEFESILPATLAAKLTNDIPPSYLAEIPTISDARIAQGHEGLSLRRQDIVDLLASRFPDLPVTGLHSNEGTTTVIQISRDVEESLANAVLTFCKNLVMPQHFQLEVRPQGGELGRATPENPMTLRPYQFRPAAPGFVKKDEAFWFDNLDAVFAGQLPLDSFPGVRPNETRCYLNLALGEHLNLRQALLLYDTIYCSMPLRQDLTKVLAQQALSEDDLLYLIGEGRLRIISIQPEERMNIEFMEAAAERGVGGVIGRRTIAALVIADLVQTANEYRLRDQQFGPALRQLSEVLAASSNTPAPEILRVLLWPVEARRSILQPLLDLGTKGIAPVGFGPYLARYAKMLGKNIEFESLVESETVHIAHALNATVLPPRNQPAIYGAVMNVLGDALNFYRSFNVRIAPAWADNEARRAARKHLMPSLPIFEFKKGVPIKDFAEEAALKSTREKGYALFSRLAELAEPEREAEVLRLEEELRKRSRRSDSRMSFDSFESMTAIGDMIFHLGLHAVMPIGRILLRLKEVARKQHPAIDRMLDVLEVDTAATFGRNQDLDFLSRIRRVAELKQERIS